MAKPSVTNIRPPVTPPKTEWNLNNPAGQADPYYALSADDDFNDFVNQINIPANGPALEHSDLEEYGYIFFGVNGGRDETVIGNNELSGIIVTGNGKDNITGGQLDDVIFSGNGKDVVNAGAGNDIVFGENGADQLNGGSDNGTASAPEEGNGPGTVTDGEGNPVFVWDHAPGAADTEAGGHGGPAGHLQKEGIWIDDGGDIHQVFSWYTGSGGAGTGPFTGFFFDGQDADTAVQDPNDGTLNLNFALADTTYYFSIQDDDGGFLYLVPGADQPVPDDKPNGSEVAGSQAYNASSDYIITPGEGNAPATFEAGDQLIGGNGPDVFVYDLDDGPNNVDLIWDINQGGGFYDFLEGDKLILENTDLEDVGDLDTFLYDVDGDLVDDVVISFGENQAIGLAGIHDTALLLEFVQLVNS